MGRFLDGIITWSILNRVVVLPGAVALLFVGIWSARRASLEVLPDFTPAIVVVQTEAPGMGTSDVEELVTRPIERVMLGTPQTNSVRSTSFPGLSAITLQFEDGVDVYRARQLVTERMELARQRLPQSVRAPALAPISAPIGALLRFCITSANPDGRQAARELRTFAEWTLKPRIISIPGVGQVTAQGGEVERIEVRPDPARLRERGVTLAQVIDAVKGAQSVAGAGFVTVGGARLDVRNEARLNIADAPSELASVIVTSQRGLPVRLGDVAEMVRGEEPPVGAALYDGRPAVFVQVSKLPWADTVRVTERVEAALRELQRSLPRGGQLEPPVFRQADFVRTSIRSVLRAMVIGGALVILVLLAFLRSGRLAVISLTAIPLSILAAVTVLLGFGASINGMTLGGLAIAVGEVVDDAIVDVENVWRRLRENARRPQPRPALDVIHDASKEIRGSVVYATLIVCLVLIPVLLLGGIAGRIFSPLAQAYILAIAASLLVALTVTPAMCAWLLPRLATPESRPTRFALWLLAHYRALLGRSVERPRTVFALAGIGAVGAIVVLPFLGGRFLPEFREGALIAHIGAVPGTSLEETVRLAQRVDAQLRPASGLHVEAHIGRAELGEDVVPVNQIEMDVVLNPEDGREWDEVVKDVSKRIGSIPGLGFAVEEFLGERIHEVLSGETAPVVVKVLGPDLGQLRGLAAEVARLMNSIAGLGTVRVEPQLDIPQLRIAPDRTALAQLGVRPLELADEVMAWRQGTSVAQAIGHGGRIINVAVAGPLGFRQREALGDVPITTRVAGWVSLSALAAIDAAPAPAAVNHEGGERRISVTASARGAGLSRAVGRLERALEALHLPEGYRVEVSGEAVARSEAALRLVLIGGLVLLGIFALLTVAFTSARDAAIVLLNFPFGLVGGVLAALLSPEGLSVAGIVGFVTLFGIISRNGIMLVAHKRLLDEQRPDEEPVARVLTASEDRLIPILMTAATAGLGLLPLALSFAAAGSELEAPMALIVCGGLISSTALNMVVLPTVYVWLIRRRRAQAAVVP